MANKNEALTELEISILEMLKGKGGEIEISRLENLERLVKSLKDELRPSGGGDDNSSSPSLSCELGDSLFRDLAKGLPSKSTDENIPCREGLDELLSYWKKIEEFALSISRGNLDVTLDARGTLPGSLKSMQGSLRHLIWQTQMIAAGDFDQNVDFLGDFAESFNSMARSLKKAHSELKEKNAELEELNGNLREAKEELEVASQYKTNFLANMSHELRTPLNSIIGFSEMMMMGMGGDLPEKQKGFAKDINDSGNHLLTLINDVLDLSKIEAGMMNLNFATLSIYEIVEKSLMFLKQRAISQNITLSSDCDPELPSVWGDLVRIKQVVVNLLSNAVKFTPDGGSVDVSAKRVVAEGSDDEQIEVCVSDTGIGISEDDIPKLFESFQQAEIKTTKEYEGTGLGLALCKNIIELHGGKIWLESKLGEGSKVFFRLPTDRSHVVSDLSSQL